MNAHRRADLALVLVAVFWGVTFPLIRDAVAEIAPVQFVAWRFGLATAAFLPLVLASPAARRGLRRAWKPGLILGLLAWFSYFTQTIGLQTVPAGRAAFITGTNVILVPLISPLFRAGRPSRVDLVAAIVATCGLYLLTRDGASGDGGLSVGDLWIFGCASAYAVYIHVLQKILRTDHSDVALAFTQVAGIFLFGALVLGFDGRVAIAATRPVLTALVVCALLATVGTFWLQTRYQGRTSPQRVALIFSLEPVFAMGFAWWLLGETLSLLGAIGALVILIAVVGAEWLGGAGGPEGEGLVKGAGDR